MFLSNAASVPTEARVANPSKDFPLLLLHKTALLLVA
jgi:hypothetical protein